MDSTSELFGKRLDVDKPFSIITHTPSRKGEAPIVYISALEKHIADSAEKEERHNYGSARKFQSEDNSVLLAQDRSSRAAKWLKMEQEKANRKKNESHHRLDVIKKMGLEQRTKSAEYVSKNPPKHSNSTLTSPEADPSSQQDSSLRVQPISRGVTANSSSSSLYRGGSTISSFSYQGRNALDSSNKIRHSRSSLHEAPESYRNTPHLVPKTRSVPSMLLKSSHLGNELSNDPPVLSEFFVADIEIIPRKVEKKTSKKDDDSDSDIDFNVNDEVDSQEKKDTPLWQKELEMKKNGIDPKKISRHRHSQNESDDYDNDFEDAQDDTFDSDDDSMSPSNQSVDLLVKQAKEDELKRKESGKAYMEAKKKKYLEDKKVEMSKKMEIERSRSKKLEDLKSMCREVAKKPLPKRVLPKSLVENNISNGNEVQMQPPSSLDFHSSNQYLMPQVIDMGSHIHHESDLLLPNFSLSLPGPNGPSMMESGKEYDSVVDDVIFEYRNSSDHPTWSPPSLKEDSSKKATSNSSVEGILNASSSCSCSTSSSIITRGSSSKGIVTAGHFSSTETKVRPNTGSRKIEKEETSKICSKDRSQSNLKHSQDRMEAPKTSFSKPVRSSSTSKSDSLQKRSQTDMTTPASRITRRSSTPHPPTSSRPSESRMTASTSNTGASVKNNLVSKEKKKKLISDSQAVSASHNKSRARSNTRPISSKSEAATTRKTTNRAFVEKNGDVTSFLWDRKDSPPNQDLMDLIDGYVEESRLEDRMVPLSKKIPDSNPSSSKTNHTSNRARQVLQEVHEMSNYLKEVTRDLESKLMVRQSWEYGSTNSINWNDMPASVVSMELSKELPSQNKRAHDKSDVRNNDERMKFPLGNSLKDEEDLVNLSSDEESQDLSESEVGSLEFQIAPEGLNAMKSSFIVNDIKGRPSLLMDPISSTATAASSTTTFVPYSTRSHVHSPELEPELQILRDRNEIVAKYLLATQDDNFSSSNMVDGDSDSYSRRTPSNVQDTRFSLRNAGKLTELIEPFSNHSHHSDYSGSLSRKNQDETKDQECHCEYEYDSTGMASEMESSEDDDEEESFQVCTILARQIMNKNLEDMKNRIKQEDNETIMREAERIKQDFQIEKEHAKTYEDASLPSSTFQDCASANTRYLRQTWDEILFSDALKSNSADLSRDNETRQSVSSLDVKNRGEESDISFEMEKNSNNNNSRTTYRNNDNKIDAKLVVENESSRLNSTPIVNERKSPEQLRFEFLDIIRRDDMIFQEVLTIGDLEAGQHRQVMEQILGQFQSHQERTEHRTEMAWKLATHQAAYENSLAEVFHSVQLHDLEREHELRRMQLLVGNQDRHEREMFVSQQQREKQLLEEEWTRWLEMATIYNKSVAESQEIASSRSSELPQSPKKSIGPQNSDELVDLLAQKLFEKQQSLASKQLIPEPSTNFNNAKVNSKANSNPNRAGLSMNRESNGSGSGGLEESRNTVYSDVFEEDEEFLGIDNHNKEKSDKKSTQAQSYRDSMEESEMEEVEEDSMMEDSIPSFHRMEKSEISEDENEYSATFENESIGMSSSMVSRSRSKPRQVFQVDSSSEEIEEESSNGMESLTVSTPLKSRAKVESVSSTPRAMGNSSTRLLEEDESFFGSSQKRVKESLSRAASNITPKSHLLANKSKSIRSTTQRGAMEDSVVSEVMEEDDNDEIEEDYENAEFEEEEDNDEELEDEEEEDSMQESIGEQKKRLIQKNKQSISKPLDSYEGVSLGSTKGFSSLHNNSQNASGKSSSDSIQKMIAEYRIEMESRLRSQEKSYVIRLNFIESKREQQLKIWNHKKEKLRQLQKGTDVFERTRKELQDYEVVINDEYQCEKADLEREKWAMNARAYKELRKFQAMKEEWLSMDPTKSLSTLDKKRGVDISEDYEDDFSMSSSVEHAKLAQSRRIKPSKNVPIISQSTLSSRKTKKSRVEESDSDSVSEAEVSSEISNSVVYDDSFMSESLRNSGKFPQEGLGRSSSTKESSKLRPQQQEKMKLQQQTSLRSHQYSEDEEIEEEEQELEELEESRKSTRRIGEEYDSVNQEDYLNDEFESQSYSSSSHGNSRRFDRSLDIKKTSSRSGESKAASQGRHDNNKMGKSIEDEDVVEVEDDTADMEIDDEVEDEMESFMSSRTSSFSKKTSGRPTIGVQEDRQSRKMAEDDEIQEDEETPTEMDELDEYYEEDFERSGAATSHPSSASDERRSTSDESLSSASGTLTSLDKEKRSRDTKSMSKVGSGGGQDISSQSVSDTLDILEQSIEHHKKEVEELEHQIELLKKQQQRQEKVTIKTIERDEWKQKETSLRQQWEDALNSISLAKNLKGLEKYLATNLPSTDHQSNSPVMTLPDASEVSVVSVSESPSNKMTHPPSPLQEGKEMQLEDRHSHLVSWIEDLKEPMGEEKDVLDVEEDCLQDSWGSHDYDRSQKDEQLKGKDMDWNVEIQKNQLFQLVQRREAAIEIQKVVRGYLAKRQTESLRKEKQWIRRERQIEEYTGHLDQDFLATQEMMSMVLDDSFASEGQSSQETMEDFPVDVFEKDLQQLQKKIGIRDDLLKEEDRNEELEEEEEEEEVVEEEFQESDKDDSSLRSPSTTLSIDRRVNFSMPIVMDDDEVNIRSDEKEDEILDEEIVLNKDDDDAIEGSEHSVNEVLTKDDHEIAEVSMDEIKDDDIEEEMIMEHTDIMEENEEDEAYNSASFLQDSQDFYSQEDEKTVNDNLAVVEETSHVNASNTISETSVEHKVSGPVVDNQEESIEEESFLEEVEDSADAMIGNDDRIAVTVDQVLKENANKQPSFESSEESEYEQEEFDSVDHERSVIVADASVPELSTPNESGGDVENFQQEIESVESQYSIEEEEEEVDAEQWMKSMEHSDSLIHNDNTIKSAVVLEDDEVMSTASLSSSISIVSGASTSDLHLKEKPNEDLLSLPESEADTVIWSNSPSKDPQTEIEISSDDDADVVDAFDEVIDDYEGDLDSLSFPVVTELSNRLYDQAFPDLRSEIVDIIKTYQSEQAILNTQESLNNIAASIAEVQGKLHDVKSPVEAEDFKSKSVPVPSSFVGSSLEDSLDDDWDEDIELHESPMSGKNREAQEDHMIISSSSPSPSPSPSSPSSSASPVMESLSSLAHMPSIFGEKSTSLPAITKDRKLTSPWNDQLEGSSEEEIEEEGISHHDDVDDEDGYDQDDFEPLDAHEEARSSFKNSSMRSFEDELDELYDFDHQAPTSTYSIQQENTRMKEKEIQRCKDEEIKRKMEEEKDPLAVYTKDLTRMESQAEAVFHQINYHELSQRFCDSERSQKPWISLDFVQDVLESENRHVSSGEALLLVDEINELLDEACQYYHHESDSSESTISSVPFQSSLPLSTQVLVQALRQSQQDKDGLSTNHQSAKLMEDLIQLRWKQLRQSMHQIASGKKHMLDFVDNEAHFQAVVHEHENLLSHLSDQISDRISSSWVNEILRDLLSTTE